MIKKKKHVDSIFESREKKHQYFYKPSFSKTIEVNFNKSNFSPNKKYYYGLQAAEHGYLNLKAIKAVVKLIKWFSKKYSLNLKFNFYFFPDFVLTSKPKEVRMGKGKGKFSEKVAVIKKGQILFEFSKVIGKEYLLNKLLKNCQIKLNIKTNPKKKIW